MWEKGSYDSIPRIQATGLDPERLVSSAWPGYDPLYCVLLSPGPEKS